MKRFGEYTEKIKSFESKITLVLPEEEDDEKNITQLQ